jgi:hypothetical protein
MADSVLYDGTDDTITVSIGQTGFTGALTIAFIVKQTADTASFRTLYTGGFTPDYAFRHNGTGMLDIWVGSAVAAPTATWQVGGGWMLGAVTKATGAATPRFHTYIYDTTTWLHENAGSASAGFSAPATSNKIGSATGGEYWNGNILIAGIWNSVLSDANIETLITGKPAWSTLSPIEAWRLDATSGIASFASGGTSTESSRVGTTLDTGDVPAGWTDSASLTPPYVSVSIA